MFELGKKIGKIDGVYFGSLTEAEFLSHFKGLETVKKLKEAYKKLPKPKKSGKKKVEDGSVLDSGKS